MRTIRTAFLVAALAVSLLAAACGSGEAPRWTYQPAPPATAAPSASAEASTEPSPGTTPTALPSASGSPAAGGSPAPSASGGSPAPSASGGSPAPSASGGSPAPSASGGSPAPSASGGTALAVTAQSITFVEKELSAPADTAFQIRFVNEDAGTLHDVDIRGQDGATIDDNEILDDAGEVTYDVDPLPAGTYTFICSIHPIPAMTGTLTVE